MRIAPTFLNATRALTASDTITSSRRTRTGVSYPSGARLSGTYVSITLGTPVTARRNAA